MFLFLFVCSISTGALCDGTPKVEDLEIPTFLQHLYFGASGCYCTVGFPRLKKRYTVPQFYGQLKKNT